MMPKPEELSNAYIYEIRAAYASAVAAGMADPVVWLYDLDYAATLVSMIREAGPRPDGSEWTGAKETLEWPFTGVVAVPGIEVSARASPFANGRPLVLQAMDLGSSPLRAARSAAPVLDFVTGVWLSGRPGPNGPCT
jgi:hypothetical protein